MTTSSQSVCFVFGAGASCDAGVPIMAQLWHGFRRSFFIDELKPKLEALMLGQPDPNIERLLAVLHGRTTGAPLAMPLPLAGIPRDTAAVAAQLEVRENRILIFEARKYILLQVSRHGSTRYLRGLRAWMEAKQLLDIFSFNYDLVVEDFCRQEGILCVDGFDHDGIWDFPGSSHETTGIRLSKLHGSIHWSYDARGRLQRLPPPNTIVRRLRAGHSASLMTEMNAMVWPGGYLAKPAAAPPEQRQLLAYFEKRLTDCRAVIVIGYEFGDEHGKQALVTAARANPDLRIYLACGTRQAGQRVKSRLEAANPALLGKCELLEPADGKGMLADSETRRRIQAHCQHP